MRRKAVRSVRLQPDRNIGSKEADMKRLVTGLAVVAILAALWSVSAVAQRSSQAEAAMAAAWQKATLEGDVRGAIKQYEAVASKYAKTDPATAATALIRAAELYQSLGDGESRRLYERVVREFSNQEAAVSHARSNLAGDRTGERTSTRVWTAPGSLLCWGSLSPNGRAFSYVSRDVLTIHDILSGRDRSLVSRPAGSERPCESVISPDGKEIATVWILEGSGYAVQISDLARNSNARVIYSTKDYPDVYDIVLHDWSPDGNYLAMALVKTDRSKQIGLLPLSGGPLRVLRSFDWRGRVASGRMTFSPDGKHLGYDRSGSGTDGALDVFVLAIDGSHETPAVERAESNERMVGWSPDGRWLLFASNRTNDNVLFGIAWAGGTTQGLPRRLADVGSRFRSLGWTPLGAMYFQTEPGIGGNLQNIELASFDLSTSRYVRVPLARRGEREQTRNALWSPDGKALAYFSSMPNRSGIGGDSAVLIRSMDTGVVRELQSGALRVLSIAAWTPDGRYLLVEGNGQDGLQNQRGIYRVDVSSGSASLVVTSPPGSLSAGVESIAPDGSFVPMFVPSFDHTIYDGRTGTVKPVIFDGAYVASEARLSSDGRTLYYRRTPRVLNAADKPAYNLASYIARDLATGKEREVIGSSRLGSVSHSPDGQYIAALIWSGPPAPAARTRELVLIPSAGGSVQVLMQSKDGHLSSPQWTSDSRSLMVWKRPDDDAQSGQWARSMELWHVPLGGEPRRIVGEAPKGTGVGIGTALSLSPDDRHFVYAAGERVEPAVTEVVALENFLPRLEKR
jgi:Tol biopolymer transport system component